MTSCPFENLDKGKSENNNIGSDEETNDCKMVDSPVYVNIQPRVMEWIFTSSGYSLEHISEKSKIPKDSLIKWVSGSAKPTVDQLRFLAKLLKRPLGAFYLPKPPEERKPPSDFRRLPSGKDILSFKTRLGIRKSQYFQETSKELLSNLNMSANPKIKRAKLSEKASEVAKREIENLSFSTDYQKSSSTTENDVLKELVKKLEEKNIFVFQFPMEIDELRGFSLINSEPFVIVINSSDFPRPKLFTLLHEYAHILLNISAMCLIKENELIIKDSYEGRVETWCNNFAGAFLMPEKAIKSDFKSLSFIDLKWLANKYKVSLYALIVRLQKINMIDYPQYQALESEILKNVKPSKIFGHRPPPAEYTIKEKGRAFCSLVLENSTSHQITTSEALGLLEIKMHTLDKLSSELSN